MLRCNGRQRFTAASSRNTISVSRAEEVALVGSVADRLVPPIRGDGKVKAGFRKVVFEVRIRIGKRFPLTEYTLQHLRLIKGIDECALAIEDLLEPFLKGSEHKKINGLNSC